MIYLIVRPLTTEVLGESWSTNIDDLTTLAAQLGGTIVNHRYMEKRGVVVKIIESGYPRKLLVGSGIAVITLIEIRPGKRDGEKTQGTMRTIQSQMRKDSRNVGAKV